jgi:hypothetical protein
MVSLRRFSTEYRPRPILYRSLEALLSPDALSPVLARLRSRVQGSRRVKKQKLVMSDDGVATCLWLIKVSGCVVRNLEID